MKDVFSAYITSLTFWFNFFATFPAIFTRQLITIQLLHMLRIINFDYFVGPGDFLVSIIVSGSANFKNMGFLFRSMMKVFLFCHWCALIWIFLGDRFPSEFSEPWMIENEDFHSYDLFD